MPRRPDLPCAGCGKLMWRGSTSAPEGAAKCRPCRRRDGDWYRERVLGECSECDRPAVARNLCSTHYSYWHRRNVSGEWRPWVSPKVRAAVYVRDAGICQICLEQVDFSADRQRDDLAPSLDHIVPKSTQLVPDHSEDNLRLAHRGCNARRGARVDVSV